MKELITIQSRLKAPKNQFNKFGGFKYRSCEDILESVKPLLAEVGCVLTISDEIVMVGNRTYVKATARIKNGSGEIEEVTANAREEETKKGMDAPQITGSASSYARKYALNGLFCIDDTKDADTTTDGGSNSSDDDNLILATQEIEGTQSTTELASIYNKYTMLHTNSVFMSNLSSKKKELLNK